MKTVVIIPSRYESSRFKGKALALINNKPMIRWVYENIAKANNIDAVYVATDDIRIKKVVSNFGGKVIMTASSHISGTDRVAEAANIIGLKDNDLIINVQGDQPLVKSQSLEYLIRPFFSNVNFEMTTLAYPIYDNTRINNSNDVKVIIDFKGFAIYFSRASIPYGRDFIKNYVRYKHLGLYAYRKKFLNTFSNLKIGRLESIEMLEQLRPIEYGYRIFVVVSPHDSPEVDISTDIERIENTIS